MAGVGGRQRMTAIGRRKRAAGLGERKLKSLERPGARVRLAGGRYSLR